VNAIEQVFGPEMVIPFLTGDDSQDAWQRAAQWMYANHAAQAYQGFLEHGRGFLFGPFATGADGRVFDGANLRAVLEAGGPVALSVTYISIKERAFRKAIPEKAIREQIVSGVTQYDPEIEVAMFLLRDGQPKRFLEGVSSGAVTPPELYEATKGGREAEAQARVQ
jgi:hypothetical protein